MSSELLPEAEPGQPVVYQIRFKGHLGSQWADWFDGLTLTREANGDTVLSGPSLDQAALYGALRKMRDLGMTIVSVNQVLSQETRQNRSNKE